MGEDLNRHSSKEDVEMTKRNRKSAAIITDM